MLPINFLAVLVCAIVGMALGMLWHGPLFGKAWMDAIGMTEAKKEAAMKKGMTKMMLLAFIGLIVMAYCLDFTFVVMTAYLKTSGVSAGIMAGFFTWLGFVTPVAISPSLWEGRSWKAFAISAGYWLAQLVLMGIILSVWM